MHVIKAQNVHSALPMGLEYLSLNGIRRASRNGEVLVAPGPVTTHYQRPRERVIFWPERDANPFFHLFESLWMLAGRKDIAYLTPFVKGMRRYSDDGETMHGAYGNRWLHHFTLVEDPGTETEVTVKEINQLSTIIAMLKKNPDDRRCVLQMWDAEVDLARDGKDIPCNTQAYFTINAEGKLDLTVCCRSNDIIWGAYGANAVHFSILQEFIAAGIGVPVGGYWQMSNNYHAYIETFEPLRCLIDHAPDPFRSTTCDVYQLQALEPFPLVSTPVEQWMQDLLMFMYDGLVIGLRDPFFRRVAVPMLMAHKAYKVGSGEERYTAAMEILEQCQANDWAIAASDWLGRRLTKFLRNEDDGPLHD